MYIRAFLFLSVTLRKDQHIARHLAAVAGIAGRTELGWALRRASMIGTLGRISETCWVQPDSWLTSQSNCIFRPCIGYTRIG